MLFKRTNIVQPGDTSTQLSNKRILRITALVAPAYAATEGERYRFGTDDLVSINPITFDIDASLLPEAMRCSCLQVERVCMANKLDEHYLIEWEKGSEFATSDTRKMYEGWKTHDGWVCISKTDKLCCIEGFNEFDREDIGVPYSWYR
jgi:hypothetical protein